MATNRKRPQKSETLTIRLDPKMRFALEFVARIKGQTITTVVERSIKDQADQVHAGDQYDGPTWLTYWDVSDGVRAIRLALDQKTHPSFEEDELIDFITSHAGYFSKTNSLAALRRDNIDVLWPNMELILKVWRETRSISRLDVRNLMDQLLEGAGLLGPWLTLEQEASDVPF